MKSITLTLPDELAAFVEQAVADGTFDSADLLFAHAIGLVRTGSVLGYAGEPPAPAPPLRPPVSPPLPAPTPAVDLTRQAFDSTAFMANLVGKLKDKRPDDGR